MKKFFVLMMAAVAVLASCQKENAVNVPEDDVVEATPITFNLTANHSDDTKAVKTGWEAGDAIFVFFSNVAAPKHLKMTFDGSSWTSTEYDGATATPGALGLKNGDTGTMRAVFLPFGSNATVSANGSNFEFNKIYYTYYLTGTLEYSVANNQVSGAFSMAIPEDKHYVQFFVEDASATDEAYKLCCDSVIPTGISSISASGTITTTTTYEDMFGYAYGNGSARGYLFSGVLKDGHLQWNAAGIQGYYFAKTKVDDNTRQDYFIKRKQNEESGNWEPELTNYCAIKLPANDNVFLSPNGNPNHGKWVPVGSGITVKIGKFNNDGTIVHSNDWQTCNYGSSTPEDAGTQMTYTDAFAHGSLPTKNQYEGLLTDASWSFVTVHGVPGRVAQFNTSTSETPFGFILLPAVAGTAGYFYYWTHNIDESSKEIDDPDDPDNKYHYTKAYHLNGGPYAMGTVASIGQENEYSVRYLGN